MKTIYTFKRQGTLRPNLIVDTNKKTLQRTIGGIRNENHFIMVNLPVNTTDWYQQKHIIDDLTWQFENQGFILLEE